MSVLRRIRRDESGVALVVAMGTLLVIGMLAFAVAEGASRVGKSSNRNTAGSRALAAAQSGINIGAYRLEKANPVPLDTQCFTTAGVAPSGGSCPWTAYQSLGNGATVRYSITPVITSAASDTCVKQPTSIPYQFKQRCITAQAMADGETRIVQRRLVQNLGGSPFPFVGALGLSGVDINQSRLKGTVGSNVLVTIGPGSRISDPGDVKLGQESGVAGRVVGNAYDGTLTQNLPQFVLDPLDEFYSAAAASNDNPGSSPGISMNNGNLNIGSNRTFWLQSGATYHFCSISMQSRGVMRLPASATEPARIFVDSFHRPGAPNYTPSGCAVRNGGGNVVDMASGAGFVNDTDRASMLQVYVYGGNNRLNPNYNVRFNSSADFTGTLYAPLSHVFFASGGNLKGAMAVDTIRFDNNNSEGNFGFQSDPDADNVTGSWDGTYLKKAWRECPPATGCS